MLIISYTRQELKKASISILLTFEHIIDQIEINNLKKKISSFTLHTMGKQQEASKKDQTDPNSNIIDIATNASLTNPHSSK